MKHKDNCEQFILVPKGAKLSCSNYVNTNGKVLSRFQCQKHKLEKLLPNFNPSLSEVENMHSAGFYRIFDLGNLKTLYVS